MKFLCDEMVSGLGRWLRAAGYDTWMPPPGADDREVVARALSDGRTILTRDAAMASRRRVAGRVLLLRGSCLREWAAQVGGEARVDWLYRPFSRCLLCNGVLQPADAEQRRRLAESRQPAESLTCCTACDKLYWPGGHVRRMLGRLGRWQRGDYL